MPLNLSYLQNPQRLNAADVAQELAARRQKSQFCERVTVILNTAISTIEPESEDRISIEAGNNIWIRRKSEILALRAEIEAAKLLPFIPTRALSNEEQIVLYDDVSLLKFCKRLVAETNSSPIIFASFKGKMKFLPPYNDFIQAIDELLIEVYFGKVTAHLNEILLREIERMFLSDYQNQIKTLKKENHDFVSGEEIRNMLGALSALTIAKQQTDEALLKLEEENKKRNLKEEESARLFTHILSEIEKFKTQHNHFEKDLTCPIGHVIMTDPVQLPDGHCYERKLIQEYYDKTIAKNETGCDLYFMLELPEGHSNYKNCYILVEKKLYYITSTLIPKLVSITDWDIFQSQLNEIKGNEQKKVYLSGKQIKQLITSNGGYIHYVVNCPFNSELEFPNPSSIPTNITVRGLCKEFIDASNIHSIDSDRGSLKPLKDPNHGYANNPNLLFKTREEMIAQMEKIQGDSSKEEEYQQLKLAVRSLAAT